PAPPSRPRVPRRRADSRAQPAPAATRARRRRHHGHPPGRRRALLDATARDAYRRRLTELREELADAEQLNDLGRSERLREELDALEAQLIGAARGRRAASHAEHARLMVTKGITGCSRRSPRGASAAGRAPHRHRAARLLLRL